MKNRIFHFLLSACVALATFALSERASAAPGDLYVGDESGILKFSPDGNKSIFASGVTPSGLAFDRTGNLFVVDYASGTIFKFTPEGNQSTFASGLTSPGALAFDGSGNLFVTESFGDVGDISKFTPAGVKSTFVAWAPNLTGLAFDLSGNLFASHGGATDQGGGITKYTPDGNGSSFAVPGGPGLAFSASGNLFAASTPAFSSKSEIVEFTPTGSRTTFTSEVQNPTGLAFDGAGNLFVTDHVSGKIFKFTPDARKSTFASGLDPGPLAFEPVTEKLRNLSARGLVGTGDEILIGGFIVGGNALANNAVVARAIGPSLSDAGVTNALQDPVLELHDTSGALIAANDNWQDTQKDQIKASGLAPTNPKESALFATLPAGNYTAVVRGAGDTTGVALVEIYSVNQ